MIRVFETLRTERVVEGPGAFGELISEVERQGFERVLLVSGRSVSKTREFSIAVNKLGSSLAGVETSVRAHNPVSSILRLADLAREIQADCIVSVGGGSPVDAAKLASLCASLDLKAREELLQYTVSRGLTSFDARNLIPVIAVPTTLSAAEWNGVAAFVDEEEQTKELVRYVELTPRTILLDPVLCAHTPRDLWVQTGVRAIDHAVETILAPKGHPSTTALASGALAILAGKLKLSGENPGDLESALECQQAAWMSLQGVHNVPMGLSHSIGHQLGAAGIPHGATSSIVLPHVLRLYAEYTSEAQERVARILADARGAVHPLAAADELDRLFDDLRAPRTIREFGLEREALTDIAEICMKEAQAVLSASARKITYEDILDLLVAAY